MTIMTQSNPQETKNTTPAKSGGKGNGKGNAPASTAQGDSFLDYLKGVKTEWTKVSWPGWPQIWGQTIVVLVMTAAITAGLFAMDQVIKYSVLLATNQSLESVANPGPQGQ